jgi:hypothetical protein
MNAPDCIALYLMSSFLFTSSKEFIQALCADAHMQDAVKESHELVGVEKYIMAEFKNLNLTN